MSEANPLVFVVIPSWNKGSFLRGTLESLLQQTYPHIEIIVQDNLSTDETAAILTAYAPKLTRVIREKDHGQSDALRRGYARAHGDILGWLNADDLLMPDAIERVVAAFRSDAQPDVVYGHCAMLTEKGQFLRYFHEIQPFSSHALRNRLNFIAQPSTFFSRQAYDRIGGVDAALHYVMDWDLWCRFAIAGCRFQFVDAVLSAAHYYGQTKTSGGGLARLREILALNRRYKTTLLPVAAAAHAYRDLIKANVPFLHGAFRRIWRLLAGRRFLTPSLIHGIAFPDQLVSSPAQIRFPVFSDLTGARILLAPEPDGAPTSPLRATLNGHEGATHQDGGLTSVTWRFDPPVYAAAVDLEIYWEPALEGLEPIRLQTVTLDRVAPAPLPASQQE